MTTMQTEAAPVRVLIADDEPSVLQMLNDLLTISGGYEVATVASGKEALDRATTPSPSCGPGGSRPRRLPSPGCRTGPAPASWRS